MGHVRAPLVRLMLRRSTVVAPPRHPTIQFPGRWWIRCLLASLVCVFTAGAYGMVMASNYNAMPRPPEVLVDGKQATVIRRRETYDDLVSQEMQPEAVG